MFKLKKFAREKIPIVHKSRKLRGIGAKLLNNSGTVNDLRMSQISGKLVEIEGSESAIAFTECDVRAVVIAQRLFKAPVHAAAVALPGFIDDNGSGLLCARLGSISRIVTHDDHAFHKRMRLEIFYHVVNRFLVIVSGEQHSVMVKGNLAAFWATWTAPLERKEDEQVDENE